MTVESDKGCDSYRPRSTQYVIRLGLHVPLLGIDLISIYLGIINGTFFIISCISIYGIVLVNAVSCLTIFSPVSFVITTIAIIAFITLSVHHHDNISTLPLIIWLLLSVPIKNSISGNKLQPILNLSSAGQNSEWSFKLVCLSLFWVGLVLYCGLTCNALTLSIVISSNLACRSLSTMLFNFYSKRMH